MPTVTPYLKLPTAFVGRSDADVIAAFGKIDQAMSQAARALDAVVPQAPRTRLAMLGHSMLARSFGGAGALLRTNGLMTATRMMAGGVFDFDYADSYAIDGYTSRRIIADLLPNLVANASHYGGALIWAFINDRSNGSNEPAGPLTLAQSKANFFTIANALLAVGVTPIFMTDPPRGNATQNGYFTGSVLADHIAFRQFMIDQAAVLPGIYVVDTWPALADPASTQGGNKPQFYAPTDDLHPNQLGYFEVNLRSPLQAVLRKVFGGRNVLPATNADRFDPTLRPGGCFNDNPTTQGTGGSATNVSGSVAANHTATLLNGAGAAVAASKFTDPDGTVWQRFVGSGTPTAANAELRLITSPTIPAAQLAPGDRIAAGVQIRIAAGQSGLNAALVMLSSSGANITGDGAALNLSETLPSDALLITPRAPVYTVPAAPLSLDLSARVTLLQSITQSWTVDIRCLHARKIVG